MSESRLILLIDDDKTSNFLNKKIIKNIFPDIVIVDFMTVEEGLDYLISANKEMKIIDLILLDINMPDLDGWDFINEIRKNEVTNFKSIAMLSSTIDENDLEKIKTMPEIKGFMTKPLKPKEIESYLGM